QARHLGRGAAGAGEDPARTLQPGDPGQRVPQAPARADHPRTGHAAPGARIPVPAGARRTFDPYAQRRPGRTGAHLARRPAPDRLRDPGHRPADRRGGAVRAGSRRPAVPRHSRRRGHRWPGRLRCLPGRMAPQVSDELLLGGTSVPKSFGTEVPPTGGEPALPVVYADEQLAVVNKPAGLMVHDSKLARGETDFAADRLREQFGKPIFLVHRLDRATSGCLLLAFDRDTASALGRSLMAEHFRKDYLA